MSKIFLCYVMLAPPTCLWVTSSKILC